MASFGRKPKTEARDINSLPVESASAPEPAESLTPEAELEIREAYKGGRTYPPTHDDEW